MSRQYLLLSRHMQADTDTGRCRVVKTMQDIHRADLIRWWKAVITFITTTTTDHYRTHVTSAPLPRPRRNSGRGPRCRIPLTENLTRKNGSQASAGSAGTYSHRNGRREAPPSCRRRLPANRRFIEQTNLRLTRNWNCPFVSIAGQAMHGAVELPPHPILGASFQWRTGASFSVSSWHNLVASMLLPSGKGDVQRVGWLCLGAVHVRPITTRIVSGDMDSAASKQLMWWVVWCSLAEHFTAASIHCLQSTEPSNAGGHWY